MRENVHKDVYRFAYDEASTELRNILKAFEQLCAQKNRVEKLMEVLKPEIGMEQDGRSQILDGLGLGEKIASTGAIFLSNKFANAVAGSS